MKTINPTSALILSNMTRKELRSTARVLGVPLGKSGTNTLANLTNALAEGKAFVKLQATIYASPDKDAPVGVRGAPVFIKQFTRGVKAIKQLSKISKMKFPFPV